jgi:hypothetical protein
LNQTPATKNPHLGFLTVFEVPSAGFGGGLLVTSCKGRPVEFHCTAPLNANRAQEILYGQTLRSFLFCDQIGIALIEKASTSLDVVVTDAAEMIELSTSVNIPFALVDLDATATAKDPSVKIDAHITKLVSANTDQTLQVLNQFTETLPLNEPFERIQQAIAEAHKVAA